MSWIGYLWCFGRLGGKNFTRGYLHSMSMAFSGSESGPVSFGGGYGLTYHIVCVWIGGMKKLC
jgi:hypothetical protein